MKITKFLSLLSFAVLASSCYEDYVFDYEYSTVGFAIENPLRTVIADREMSIYVGVSIGGKRQVDKSDWATFEIVPSLLEGTGLTLLPETHYRLADPNTFTIRKSNLPVADVEISFTDEFYADPLATGKHYALPFKIIDSSLDSVYRRSSVVAIKYISTYHGSYYISGTMDEIRDGTVTKTTEYGNKDLSQREVRDLTTVSTTELIRPGVGNFPVSGNEKVRLTFKPETLSNGVMKVEIGTVAGAIDITDGSGTYDTTGERPMLKLSYSFIKNGITYSVNESLILRQDPYLDLRVEKW